MIVGSFDDISEEGSYEFTNMKATSNAETEFAMGREPTEMSPDHYHAFWGEFHLTNAN
jgi:fatty acid synthase subunit alpha, fungi type